MKKQLITALLAGVLFASAASFAVSENFTPEMGSVDTTSTEYKNWQKPAILVTNTKGFILGKNGQPYTIPIDDNSLGYFKTNADKTGFEMSAGGPTVYTKNGQIAGQQLPAMPNAVPDSPYARNHAHLLADYMKSLVKTKASIANFTAAQRIDSNSGQILQNAKDIVNVDGRLQKLQNSWNGSDGDFGTGGAGNKLTAGEAINQNQDDIQILKDRLAGRNNVGAWGSAADGTPYNLEQGFGHLYNQSKQDHSVLDMGKNADGSQKTVTQYVKEYVEGQLRK